MRLLQQAVAEQARAAAIQQAAGSGKTPVK
jgi:hypothetical protein